MESKNEKIYFWRKKLIHIIDLTQTVDFIKSALMQVHKVIAGGGKLLIVSTKKQASEQVSDLAKETGQYFVNFRWLGGMLTNWNTIQNSIRRLKKLNDQLSKENLGFTKKELLKFGKEKEKLQRSLGGISEMKKTPDLIFIIDTNIESLAVAEAKKLGIPIIAVLDTNSDPTGIEFPIPGNDDATRAIDLYCNLVADAVLDGIQQELSSAGVDIGAMEPKVEEIPGAEEVAVEIISEKVEEVAVEIISEKVEEVAVEVVSAKVKVKKQPPVKPVAEKEKAEEKP